MIGRYLLPDLKWDFAQWISPFLRPMLALWCFTACNLMGSVISKKRMLKELKSKNKIIHQCKALLQHFDGMRGRLQNNIVQCQIEMRVSLPIQVRRRDRLTLSQGLMKQKVRTAAAASELQAQTIIKLARSGHRKWTGMVTRSPQAMLRLSNNPISPKDQSSVPLERDQSSVPFMRNSPGDHKSATKGQRRET
jgi:hypothetical protein